MRELRKRKPNRLNHYDYSQSGYYFITICINNRQELLWGSTPVGARIARPPLSDIGEVVNKAIENIPHIYKSIVVDKYVIMPNHIHLILIIPIDHGRAMRAPTIPIDHGHAMRAPTIPIDHGRVMRAPTIPIDHGRAMRAPTISTAVNQMKGYVSKKIGYSIWQKLFHDHVIRNEADYLRIWKYIDENPINWQDDCFYPK